MDLEWLAAVWVPSDETETVSLGSGETEPAPKGSGEAEPAVLGETPMALGSDEAF